LGLANLGANWLIAAANPALRALLVERMTGLAPLIGVVAAPLVEEVAVRLFLMSAIAWLVSRATGRASLAFVVALAGSSLVFALLHLARPVPGDQALANFYRAALIAKYTLAGLPLGWVFWRSGLPYAIVCHVAANAAHLAVQSRVF
jgi:membrane protease YdiL (CAAX protease family)